MAKKTDATLQDKDKRKPKRKAGSIKAVTKIQARIRGRNTRKSLKHSPKTCSICLDEVYGC